MRRFFVLLVLGLASTVPAGSQTPDPDAALRALIDAEWDHQMEHNPVWASILGDRRFNDRWDDLSAAALERDQAHNADLLRRLDAVDRAALSEERRLDLDLLRYEVAQWIEEDGLRWYLLPLDHLGWPPEGLRQRQSVAAAFQLAGSLRFATTRDYEDWLVRLRTFPTYVDQTLDLMREGVRAGMVHPRVVVERILPVLDGQTSLAAQETGFFEPFLSFPEGVPEDRREGLAADGERAIAEGVLPALRKLRAYVAGEYLSAAPEAVGIWQLPRGAELYAFFTRHHTTTDMTPDEIHELGLAEVRRLRAEMETVREEVGFAGTLQELFDHLRTDPGFFHTDPDDLLTAYRALAKRIDPLLIGLFGTLPRMPYGVEPMSPIMAPNATTGFYVGGAEDGSRPGTYLVNLYRPETRPKWEMVSLTLHEAVPGHHLQGALAAELDGLPAFRRLGYHTAFGEGWALYSEWLGYEMGLYDDPYDRFGQLAYEMWRAVRLVVDTGIHTRRWTRQQAIEFFLERSPRPQLDVVNEVDRYIAVPGQALAYKIGQIKIRRLRENAARRLGPRFDVRAFHDLVLGAGSLPLDLLEKRVEAWEPAPR